VSDFNPVFLLASTPTYSLTPSQTLLQSRQLAVALATVLSPHSRHPGIHCRARHLGIPPRRALAHDAGFGIRVVRQWSAVKKYK